jgi:PTH2 family peptidyl-tRNA hydrolase
MRKGKIAAKVAHASKKFLVDNNEASRNDELYVKLNGDEAMWLLSGSFTKIVVSVDSEKQLEDLIFKAKMEGVECHEIVDSGRTEFDGIPTLTCAAFGPADALDIDGITGKLKLM